MASLGMLQGPVHAGTGVAQRYPDFLTNSPRFWHGSPHQLAGYLDLPCIFRSGLGA